MGTDEKLNVDEIVKEAMFKAMAPETRDKLMKDALTKLIAPGLDRWGNLDKNAASPLQLAFGREVELVSQRYVAELFAGDTPEAVTMREQIKNLVFKGWEMAMADPNRMVERIAKAIGSAFVTRRDE